MKKTLKTKKADIVRVWHLVDLDSKVLGREATKIATKLMGKEKPYFMPNLDCGDYVVVINALKVRLTGKKMFNKLYRHHTGYPGGFRETTFLRMMEKDPRKVIEKAVSGMLPKNKLRRLRLKRLKIFVDGKHPYEGKFISTKEKKELSKKLDKSND